MMRRGSIRRGTTLVEIMAGVFVLSLTVITAMALMPATATLRDRSGGYSRAAALGLKKLEQLRKLDISQLTSSQLQAGGIVDTTYTWDLSTTAVYTFTTVDRVATELRSGSGYLVFSGLGSSLVRADIYLYWRGFNGRYYWQQAGTYLSDKAAWREP